MFEKDRISNYRKCQGEDDTKTKSKLTYGDGWENNNSPVINRPKIVILPNDQHSSSIKCSTGHQKMRHPKLHRKYRVALRQHHPGAEINANL